MRPAPAVATVPVLVLALLLAACSNRPERAGAAGTVGPVTASAGVPTATPAAPSVPAVPVPGVPSVPPAPAAPPSAPARASVPPASPLPPVLVTAVRDGLTAGSGYYRLRSVPAGYAPPRDAGYDAPTLQYLPLEGANTAGRRISVQASADPADSVVAPYAVRGTTPVRGGRSARYVQIGAVASRYGLVWQESPGVSVGVYGDTDLAGLQRLAEQVEPCPARGC